MAASAAATAVGTAASAASPSGKIRLGVIGCGRRGRSNLRSVLKLADDIEVVAVSEVFEPNLQVTLEMVPNARVLWAAVILFWSKISPLAVGRPWNWSP